MKRALVATGLGITAAYAASRRWVGPWQRGWGTTDEERHAVLPGDELLAEPADQVTRAITIATTPDAVWAWVVQLGADRGGFYSYDWLENLFGLRIHSADRVVDEWQHLSVGDVVYADRRRSGGWYVVEIRAPEVLVLQVADLRAGRPARRSEGIGWEFQWTFALRPDQGGGTRLLVRERTAFSRRITRCLMAPIGLVSFVMTRRMLLGIRTRAEALPAGSAVVDVDSGATPRPTTAVLRRCAE